MTDDNLLPFCFPAVRRKKITAAFDGGRISSDGGVMLLAQADRRLGIAERLAQVIPDGRDPDRVTHLLPDILRARIFAIACGYEDADDLDRLRCWGSGSGRSGAGATGCARRGRRGCATGGSASRRRRAADEEIERMQALYEERYGGFTVKHFHEQLRKRHGYKLGYTVTRLSLQAAGLVQAGAAARGASPEAAAPAAAGHDAASGRLAHAWLPGEPGARPGGHPRRRDERDLLGLPGRGGGHRIELARRWPR